MCALDEGMAYRDLAMQHGRDNFYASPSYGFASATTSVLRIYTLFEKEHKRFSVGVSRGAKRGISKIRNTAAHIEYSDMDYDILWNVIESLLPDLVETLRAEADRQLLEHRTQNAILIKGPDPSVGRRSES